MSTSDNNCAEECCQGCTQSFCQSCGESCSANCEESCNRACSDSCSNACSDVTCKCGSTTEIAIFPLLVSYTGALLSSILLGIIQAFDSQGPILMTLFGSSILALSLSGVRINKLQRTQTCNIMNNRSAKFFSTKIGWISINHSHHPSKLIEAGHEFRLKNKYFCTGCYGLLLGTLLSVVLGFFYILNGFNSHWSGLFLFMIPLCFFPIILRYLLPYKVPSSMKLVANSLLPVGCSLLLIYTDIMFHNWSLNVLTVLLILTAAFLRGAIAQKENKGK